MTAPALRALKETFNCTITVLTSPMSAPVAPFIPDIDDIIVFNAPWVKTDEPSAIDQFYKPIDEIKCRQFDAAVIFTVYSQNPMPSIILAFLAGIPLRLAYCRENPYQLLTNWIPDKEPYTFVQHQVRRDLKLVESVGAHTKDKLLCLKVDEGKWPDTQHKLRLLNIEPSRPWIIFHPGVSEEKRRYPVAHWIETGRKIREFYGVQILITGTENEKDLAEEIRCGIGSGCFSLAGLMTLEEFILLVKKSPLIISVNTSSIHIAAATNTPVIVLYALTNPQHTPWKATGRVLWYDVPEKMRSKNEVIRFVHNTLHPRNASMVTPRDVLRTLHEVLTRSDSTIPEMLPLRSKQEELL